MACPSHVSSAPPFNAVVDGEKSAMPVQPFDYHRSEVWQLSLSIELNLGTVVQRVLYVADVWLSANPRAIRGRVRVTDIGAAGR